MKRKAFFKRRRTNFNHCIAVCCESSYFPSLCSPKSLCRVLDQQKIVLTFLFLDCSAHCKNRQRRKKSIFYEKCEMKEWKSEENSRKFHFVCIETSLLFNGLASRHSHTFTACYVSESIQCREILQHGMKNKQWRRLSFIVEPLMNVNLLNIFKVQEFNFRFVAFHICYEQECREKQQKAHLLL